MKEPSAVECIILTRCSIVVLPKLKIRDNLLTHLIQFSLTLQLFFFLTHIFFLSGQTTAPRKARQLDEFFDIPGYRVDFNVIKHAA